MGATVFDEHQQRWLDYRMTPWARLRYAVVQQTLSRHVSPSSRVIDVGGGDGGDALPLMQAGHEVTVLDSSTSMLALASLAGLRTMEGSLDALPPGSYDVVLCHFVLQYRPDTAADVARLATLVAPGGVLSLIVPNPIGPVLSAAARRGPAAALAELDATSSHTVTFDRDVRRISDAEVLDALEAFEVVGRYGIRCLNDVVLDDERKKADGQFFDDLLRLELAVCDREPFRQMGMFTQVVARRG